MNQLPEKNSLCTYGVTLVTSYIIGFDPALRYRVS